MPNFEAYVNQRLNGKNIFQLDMVEKPSAGFQSGTSKKLNSVQIYAEKMQLVYEKLDTTNRYSGDLDRYIEDLLAINPYEGILAIAYILGFPECKSANRFTSLTLTSIFNNLKPQKDDQLLDAFVIIFKQVNTLVLDHITLSDELIDFILEAIQKAGKQGQVKLNIDQFNLTHRQLVKLIDLMPKNLVISCTTPSTYTVEKDPSPAKGSSYLHICGCVADPSQITAQEIKEILTRRKGSIKKLIFSQSFNPNLIIEDDDIEELEFNRESMGFLSKDGSASLQQFFGGFKKLNKVTCNNLVFPSQDAKQKLVAIIGNLHNLTHISLAKCNLDDSVVDEIIKIIRTNKSLVSLDLFGNEFTVNGYKRIVEAIDESNLTLQNFVASRPKTFMCLNPKPYIRDRQPEYSEAYGLLMKCLTRNKNILALEKMSEEAIAHCTETENTTLPGGKAELMAVYEKMLRAKDLAKKLQDSHYKNTTEANLLVNRVDDLLSKIRESLFSAVKRELEENPSMSILELPSVGFNDRFLYEVVIPYIKSNQRLTSIVLGVEPNHFTTAAMGQLGATIRDHNLSVTSVVGYRNPSPQDPNSVIYEIFTRSLNEEVITSALQRNLNRDHYEVRRQAIEQQLQSLGFSANILMEAYGTACELANVSYPEPRKAEELLTTVKQRLTDGLLNGIDVGTPAEQIVHHREIVDYLAGLNKSIHDNNLSDRSKRIMVARCNAYLKEFSEVVLPLLKRYVENAFIKLIELSHSGHPVEREVLYIVSQLYDIVKTVSDYTVGSDLKLLDECVKMCVGAFLRSRAINFSNKEIEKEVEAVLQQVGDFGAFSRAHVHDDAHHHPYPRVFVQILRHADSFRESSSARITKHFQDCLLYASTQNFSYKLKAHAQLVSLLFGEEYRSGRSTSLTSVTPVVIANLNVHNRRGYLLDLYFIENYILDLTTNVPANEVNTCRAYLYQLFIYMTANPHLRRNAYKVLLAYLDINIQIGFNAANIDQKLLEFKELSKQLDSSGRELFSEVYSLRIIPTLLQIKDFKVLSSAVKLSREDSSMSLDSCCMAYNQFVQEEAQKNRLVRKDALSAVIELNDLITYRRAISREAVSYSCETFYSVLMCLKNLSHADSSDSNEIDFKSQKYRDYLRKIDSYTNSIHLKSCISESLFDSYKSLADVLYTQSVGEEAILLKNIRASTDLRDILQKLNRYAEENPWTVKFSALRPNSVTARLKGMRDEMARTNVIPLPAAPEQFAARPAAANPKLSPQAAIPVSQVSTVPTYYPNQSDDIDEQYFATRVDEKRFATPALVSAARFILQPLPVLPAEPAVPAASVGADISGTTQPISGVVKSTNPDPVVVFPTSPPPPYNPAATAFFPVVFSTQGNPVAAPAAADPLTSHAAPAAAAMPPQREIKPTPSEPVMPASIKISKPHKDREDADLIDLQNEGQSDDQIPGIPVKGFMVSRSNAGNFTAAPTATSLLFPGVPKHEPQVAEAGAAEAQPSNPPEEKSSPQPAF